MNRQLILLTLAFFLASDANAQDADPNLVKDVNFVADYFPADGNDKYGVIVLTGSAGGRWTELAEKVAGWGYPVLSLGYFDDGPLVPEALEMIPLEYFEAPKQWLINRKDTKNDGVILIGGSKGAELALVLASWDSDYKGAIAIGPSSVVWAGIPEDRSKITSASSSWSVNGEPLPFVPYISRAGLQRAGLNKMLYWHVASLANDIAVEQAFIEVEKIRSPMLLLSGGADLSWPSDTMAAAVCNRANSNKNDAICNHINYEDAPHMLGEMIGAADKEMAKFLEAVNQTTAESVH